MLQRLIDRVFAFERIDGDRCPYLHRWRLASFGRKRFLYLHHFVGSDWSRDPHDHPKRFISIGLWGSYIEETPSLASLALAMNGQATADVFRWPCRTEYRAPVGSVLPRDTHPSAHSAAWRYVLDARVHRPRDQALGIFLPGWHLG